MKKLLLLAGLLLILTSASPQVQGTNLRGQLRTTNPITKSTIAMAKVIIDMYKRTPGGNNWVLVATTISDPNGFYYFNRVAPGNYFIQVNKRRNYDIVVVWIDERHQQFQDLPLLVY